jgi:hypothetical protein
MKTSLRFLSKSLAFAALGVLAAAAPSLAANVSFKANSIFGNAEPNNAAGKIVVYDLPATGSIYAGPVDAFFDVRAKVSGGGSETVAGYGVIMQITGAGTLPTFTTPDPNEAGDNNMLAAVRTPINSTLSIILGETNVPTFDASNHSLGVIGLFPTANTNTTVADNAGLFKVPFRVAAGAAASGTQTYNLQMALGGNEYSGFARSDGTLMTDPGSFPHDSNVIEVRRSRRGDTNGDGATNSADIGTFIQVLNTGAATYKAANPWLQVNYITDFDQSGATNSADIGGFIAALNGAPSPAAGPSAVPEPSTIALLCIGGGMLAAGALRRRKAHSIV